jgi:hypothetical protein
LSQTQSCRIADAVESKAQSSKKKKTTMMYEKKQSGSENGPPLVVRKRVKLRRKFLHRRPKMD